MWKMVAESEKETNFRTPKFSMQTVRFLFVLTQELHTVLRRGLGLGSYIWFSFSISGDLSSPPPCQTGLLLPAGGQRLQAPHPLLQARLGRRHVTRCYGVPCSNYVIDNILPVEWMLGTGWSLVHIQRMARQVLLHFSSRRRRHRWYCGFLWKVKVHSQIMLINIIVVIIDNHNRIIADNTSSSISKVDPWDLQPGSRSSLFLAENLGEREEKRQASPGHHCEFFKFCAWIINWKGAKHHLVTTVIFFYFVPG